MSTNNKTQKKPIPAPGNRQNFKAAHKATLKQFKGSFAKLAK